MFIQIFNIKEYTRAKILNNVGEIFLIINDKNIQMST